MKVLSDFVKVEGIENSIHMLIQNSSLPGGKKIIVLMSMSDRYFAPESIDAIISALQEAKILAAKNEKIFAENQK